MYGWEVSQRFGQSTRAEFEVPTLRISSFQDSSLLCSRCNCPKSSHWFFIPENLWVFYQSFSHSTYHPLNSILSLKIIKVENFSWGHFFLPSVDSFPESICFFSFLIVHCIQVRYCLLFFFYYMKKGSICFGGSGSRSAFQTLWPRITQVSSSQVSDTSFLPASCPPN